MHSTALPLDAWIQTFLRSPGGNLALADGLLREPRSYFGPFHLPLTELKRCCGPEAGMAYPVSPESFERRVEGLRSFLQGGGEVAPLIVNFEAGTFVLTDGNHRHEALRRQGAEETAVVVWTTGEEDRRGFLERYGAWLSLEEPWRQGLEHGREGVVGCLVVRPDGRVFAQRRSPSRRTFPGCWDLVGGHLEPGESPRRALVRELAEETGWTLESLLGLRRVVDWQVTDEGGTRLKRELVVAVTVKGDWDAPRLEPGKVTEGRWFGPGDLEILNENRNGDAYVYDLIQEELNR